MFVNNKKITEELAISSAIVPAVAAAASSSALVNMSQYRKYLAIVEQGVVTTAGSLVVKVFESTASTWNGAVATEVAAARTTTSVATSSGALVTVEIDASDITKPYVGVHVTNADGDVAAIGAQHVRGGARYL